MRIRVSLIVFIITLSTSSFAMFGMSMNPMKMMNSMPMNPMKMMNPQQMLLSMCSSGMGKMGAGMANMVSSMMPFGKSMKSSMTASMMVSVLNHPTQTLQALDCAQTNDQVVTMMLQALSTRPRLLHKMGGAMVLDYRIAKSMMTLALRKPHVGRFLLNHVDPILFNQLTHAIYKHTDLAYDMTLLVYNHRLEVLSYGSPLMKNLTHFGSTESSSDANEKSGERMLRAVFSNIKAANLFIKALNEIEPDTKNFLLDVMFLGKVAYYNYDGSVGTTIYPRQSHYNLYAIVYGLRTSLIRGQNSSGATAEKASAEELKLMKNMMGYMNDPKTKRPTSWGIQFTQVIMDGAMVHKDPSIGDFVNFLSDLMDSRFSKHLPTPNPDSPAPREIVNSDLPFIPQLLNR